MGYLYKSPAEEPSTILGKFEPDTVANYFSDRLIALINIEKRYPASLPYLLSVYGVQTLSYTEREIADSGTATDRKSCFSYVSVVDHTLPYADRVEQILELVKSQTVPVLEASSLYFPTLADAYKKLDDDGIRVFGEQTASTIERFQTWFALTEPEPGGLSKTGILVQNFSEHTLKGFVIKYVDAEFGKDGWTTYHLVNTPKIFRNEIMLVQVNIYVPPAMFMGGVISSWTLDVVDAF